MFASMKTSHRIGPWLFDVGEKILRSTEAAHRLEDRTARTLAMLCERRGQIVGKDEILLSVWEGRTVSPNSVAIVIGDLRRALKDDPKAPLHIQTIPQRGYRLTDEPESPPCAAPGLREVEQTITWRRGRDRFIGSVAAIAVTAIAAALLVKVWLVVPAIGMIVEPTVNATGQAGLDPLAASIGAVVLGCAARLPNMHVLAPPLARRNGDEPLLELRSKLIIWNGAPEVALVLTVPKTGAVQWTSFAGGPVGMLAATVTARIATLQAAPAR